MTDARSGARNRNELWATVLVEEIARAGVREVVVCPGSRSTPLVLAVAAHPALRVVPHLDERSAGFFALGIGKATGRPAAVVTTSGTAVANLLPSVVEAAQSEAPLLLLTADRPPHLRGADANQAIVQPGIFGAYPRFEAELVPDPTPEGLLHLRQVACRAVAEALGAPAGPVHLNVPFRKPLEPTRVEGDISLHLTEHPFALEGRASGEPLVRIHPRRAAPPVDAVAALTQRIRGAQRPLLVAGPLPDRGEAGGALRAFAGQHRIPLLADALSGARFPPLDGDLEAAAERHVVGTYDLALRTAEVTRGLRPDLVIRFGAAPTSARLLGWLGELAEVPQVVVHEGGRWKDHLATASEMVVSDVRLLLEALPACLASPDPEWARVWSTLEGELRRLVAEGDAHNDSQGDAPAIGEGEIVGRIVRGVPAGDLLFASGSMPIREVDAFVPHRDGALTVLGNRGASGIDGINSTAAGASFGSGARVVAVVGDLAFLHDQTGLSLLREQGVDVLLVVVNNDGGGIFHHLPVREYEPEFTRYFATPHGRDLSHLAALHDLPYRCADLRESSATLDDALAWALDRTAGSGGSRILELRTDRDQSFRLRGEAIRRLTEAARASLA
ncbi:MAG: 2-succinyl-5-enolpyruvyl-6-hydroxy-3-cyclohexene-1-carboxylic-acid synthase [Gemmatimonadota bacterium]